MGFFSGITSLFYRNDSALHHDQAAARREQEGISEGWIDDSSSTEQPGSPVQNNAMLQQTQTLLTTATSISANIALASTVLTPSLTAHVIPSATSSVAATASSVIGSSATNTEHAATSHVFHLPSSLVTDVAFVEGHVPAKMPLSQRINGIANYCIDSLKRGKNRTVEVINKNKETIIIATVAVVAVASFIAFRYFLTSMENNAYQRGYDVAYLKALKDCRESVVVAKSSFWWWPF